MLPITAFFVALGVYLVVRVGATAFFTVKPNERAVIASFGRAQRLSGDLAETVPELSEVELERYNYPQLSVIKPGGPYFKWPWQRVHKVNIATDSVPITWDPTKPQTVIEAVTKDNLTTGINGQIRFRVSERNLYAYLFGVQSPLEHIMGYFVSILRERVANFSDPKNTLLEDTEMEAEASELTEGVSINDLRKNLALLNQYMEEQCTTTAARYGIELDAALITKMDPPEEVDRALAAINSTRNQVAADISTARAEADQQITMSKRAVEIATNNAEAEIAPLLRMGETLTAIKASGGSKALTTYLRNMRVPLLKHTKRMVERSK